MPPSASDAQILDLARRIRELLGPSGGPVPAIQRRPGIRRRRLKLDQKRDGEVWPLPGRGFCVLRRSSTAAAADAALQQGEEGLPLVPGAIYKSYHEGLWVTNAAQSGEWIDLAVADDELALAYLLDFSNLGTLAINDTDIASGPGRTGVEQSHSHVTAAGVLYAVTAGKVYSMTDLVITGYNNSATVQGQFQLTDGPGGAVKFSWDLPAVIATAPPIGKAFKKFLTFSTSVYLNVVAGTASFGINHGGFEK